MSMLGGGGSPGMGPGMGGENPLAALLAQMGGAGGPPNPLGITSGPDGLGSDFPGSGTTNEDPMAAMFKAMSEGPNGAGGGGSPFGNLPPGLFGGGDPSNPNALFPPAQQSRKPLIQRIFPIVHVLAMVALWAFIVLWWEPSLHSTLSVGTGKTWSWRNLAKYGLLSGTGEGGKFRNLERDLERQTRFATLVRRSHSGTTQVKREEPA